MKSEWTEANCVCLGSYVAYQYYRSCLITDQVLFFPQNISSRCRFGVIEPPLVPWAE